MKKLNREQVFIFNRKLTQTMKDIEKQICDLDGYEGNTYIIDPAFESLHDRLENLQEALHALKKELYEISEPKTKEQA